MGGWRYRSARLRAYGFRKLTFREGTCAEAGRWLKRRSGAPCLTLAARAATVGEGVWEAPCRLLLNCGPFYRKDGSSPVPRGGTGHFPAVGRAALLAPTVARVIWVKPDYFSEHNLTRMGAESGLPVQLTFGALFLAAGENGVFDWHPRTIRVPFNPATKHFLAILDILAQGQFIERLEGDPPRGRICDYSLHHCFGIVEDRPRPVSPSVRKLVLRRDGHRCRQCPSTEHLQVDHVVPLALGGSNDPANLQALCAECNRKKGPRAYARQRRR